MLQALLVRRRRAVELLAWGPGPWAQPELNLNFQQRLPRGSSRRNWAGGGGWALVYPSAPLKQVLVHSLPVHLPLQGQA